MVNLSQKCPTCNSTRLIEKIQPLDSTHYAKLACGDCGNFIRWLPNPSVTAEFEVRKKIIDEMLMMKIVSGWENLFLRSVRDARVLSPKRKQKFLQICSRHGIKIPARDSAGCNTR